MIRTKSSGHHTSKKESIFSKIFNTVFLLILTTMLFPAISFSNQPQLTWAPVDAMEDYIRYRVYYKVTSHYTNEDFEDIDSNLFIEDAGEATSFPLTDLNLEVGQTYIFVVRTYSPCGAESENSELCTFQVTDFNQDGVADYMEEYYDNADQGSVYTPPDNPSSGSSVVPSSLTPAESDFEEDIDSQASGSYIISSGSY